MSSSSRPPRRTTLVGAASRTTGSKALPPPPSLEKALGNLDPSLDRETREAAHQLFVYALNAPDQGGRSPSASAVGGSPPSLSALQTYRLALLCCGDDAPREELEATMVKASRLAPESTGVPSKQPSKQAGAIGSVALTEDQCLRLLLPWLVRRGAAAAKPENCSDVDEMDDGVEGDDEPPLTPSSRARQKARATLARRIRRVCDAAPAVSRRSVNMSTERALFALQKHEKGLVRLYKMAVEASQQSQGSRPSPTGLIERVSEAGFRALLKSLEIFPNLLTASGVGASFHHATVSPLLRYFFPRHYAEKRRRRELELQQESRSFAGIPAGVDPSTPPGFEDDGDDEDDMSSERPHREDGNTGGLAKEGGMGRDGLGNQLQLRTMTDADLERTLRMARGSDASAADSANPYTRASVTFAPDERLTRTRLRTTEATGAVVQPSGLGFLSFVEAVLRLAYAVDTERVRREAVISFQHRKRSSEHEQGYEASALDVLAQLDDADDEPRDDANRLLGKLEYLLSWINTADVVPRFQFDVPRLQGEAGRADAADAAYASGAGAQRRVALSARFAERASQRRIGSAAPLSPEPRNHGSPAQRRSTQQYRDPSVPSDASPQHLRPDPEDHLARPAPKAAARSVSPRQSASGRLSQGGKAGSATTAGVVPSERFATQRAEAPASAAGRVVGAKNSRLVLDGAAYATHAAANATTESSIAKDASSPFSSGRRGSSPRSMPSALLHSSHLLPVWPGLATRFAVTPNAQTVFRGFGGGASPTAAASAGLASTSRSSGDTLDGTTRGNTSILLDSRTKHALVDFRRRIAAVLADPDSVIEGSFGGDLSSIVTALAPAFVPMPWFSAAPATGVIPIGTGDDDKKGKKAGRSGKKQVDKTAGADADAAAAASFEQSVSPSQPTLSQTPLCGMAAFRLFLGSTDNQPLPSSTIRQRHAARHGLSSTNPMSAGLKPAAIAQHGQSLLVDDPLQNGLRPPAADGAPPAAANPDASIDAPLVPTTTTVPAPQQPRLCVVCGSRVVLHGVVSAVVTLPPTLTGGADFKQALSRMNLDVYACYPGDVAWRNLDAKIVEVRPTAQQQNAAASRSGRSRSPSVSGLGRSVTPPRRSGSPAAAGGTSRSNSPGAAARMNKSSSLSLQQSLQQQQLRSEPGTSTVVSIAFKAHLRLPDVNGGGSIPDAVDEGLPASVRLRFNVSRRDAIQEAPRPGMAASAREVIALRTFVDPRPVSLRLRLFRSATTLDAFEHDNVRGPTRPEASIRLSGMSSGLRVAAKHTLFEPLVLPEP